MLFIDAIMRSGDWSNYYKIGLTTEQLAAETQKRFDQYGQRLESISSWDSNGEPLWAAIYRDATWASWLTVNRDTQTFLTESQNLFDTQGLRLVQMVPYRSGGQLLWAGSYQSGDWVSQMTVNRDTQTFWDESQKFFDEQGLRITYMVSYENNGQLLWAAVYQAGDWPSRLTMNRDRATLVSESQTLFDQEGWRLQQVWPYKVNGLERWAAIYRGGDWASRFLLGYSRPDFEERAQRKFDEEGLRLSYMRAQELPAKGITLHLKILEDPSIAIADQLEAMRDTYGEAGLVVELGSRENLTAPTLLDIDAGACATGSITADQQQLFANKNNVGANDIVIYFVRTLFNGATSASWNGCAIYPSGTPGAIVASYASKWTLAHEVGHVLGLSHCDNKPNCLLTRLMTGCGTDNITKSPPDLVVGEATTMQASGLSVGM